MKILLLIAFTVSSISLFSQQYSIRPEIQPDSEYFTKMKMNMTFGFDAKGLDEEVDETDNMMMNLLKGMNTAFTSETKLKVGKPNSEGNYPVALTLLSYKPEIDESIKDMASEHLDLSDMNLDSIVQSGLSLITEYNPKDKKFISSFSGAAEQMSTMVSMLDMKDLVPQRDMEVGESDTLYKNLPLPMAGGINMMSIYKLHNVNNGKAFFTIDYAISTDIDEKNNSMMPKMDMKIMGVGSAVYNLEDNYFIQNDSSATITMDMNFDQEDDEGIAMTINMSSVEEIRLEK